MTISWFSIQASIPIPSGGGSNTIVNYYFSVDTTTNLITAFYNYNNIGVNVLAPATLPSPFNVYTASNFFNGSTLVFDINGVNYTDANLQTILSNNSPYYNFYNEAATLKNTLWSNTSINNGTTYASFALTTNYINIQRIPGPPSPVPCFKEDTKILTDKGYICIQDLRKGDLVKTLYDGYKPIDLIAKREIHHPALEKRFKDQLYKCSKDNFNELFEPLIITGGHSILVDELTEKEKQKTLTFWKTLEKVNNKYKLLTVINEKAKPYEERGNFTIYHLALETEDENEAYGIYANGLLVESCSKRYLKELYNRGRGSARDKMCLPNRKIPYRDMAFNIYIAPITRRSHFKTMLQVFR